jgi:hypothetical protein
MCFFDVWTLHVVVDSQIALMRFEKGKGQMDKSKWVVGQRVKNIERFNPPADVRVGTIGKVIQRLPEEMWVQFAGKRVRAPHSAFEQV